MQWHSAQSNGASCCSSQAECLGQFQQKWEPILRPKLHKQTDRAFPVNLCSPDTPGRRGAKSLMCVLSLLLGPNTGARGERSQLGQVLCWPSFGGCFARMVTALFRARRADALWWAGRRCDDDFADHTPDLEMAVIKNTKGHGYLGVRTADQSDAQKRRFALRKPPPVKSGRCSIRQRSLALNHVQAGSGPCH